MNHVTNRGLRRLLARIASRLHVTGDYAAWHGWTIQRTGLGNVYVGDPRFDQFKARADVPVAGRF